jgi:hypothetical protein
VLGEELHLAPGHGVEASPGEVFHFHEPLIGEHGLDDDPGAA